jgi:hypothetical protein
MKEFRQYKRLGFAEARPVTQDEVTFGLTDKTISVSDADLKNGSPKLGDMIARNPDNHKDQWLIAEDYFKTNFEQIPIELHK